MKERAEGAKERLKIAVDCYEVTQELTGVGLINPGNFFRRLRQPLSPHGSSYTADEYGVDDRGTSSVYVYGCSHFRRTGK